MKPVLQKEKTGCAIASAAALSGLSYSQAKRIANQIGIFAEDKKLWSETTYIIKLLTQLKIKTAKNRATLRDLGAVCPIGLSLP